MAQTNHISFFEVSLDSIPPGGLSKQDFRVVDSSVKRSFFENDLAQADLNRTRDLLNNLNRLAPQDARCLSATRSTDELVFRLYDERPNAAKKGHSSYLALSHCWPQKNPKDKVKKGKENPLMHPFPVSEPMVAAVLRERREGEGFWYDKGCIDQDSGAEKSVSIGMMDTIYRCARSVIVAIDDVLITSAQKAAITEYKALYDEVYGNIFNQEAFPEVLRADWGLVTPDHTPPELRLLAKGPDFRSFVEAFVASRLFTRVWCSHEIYIAKDVTFLVRCKPSLLGSIRKQPETFLRFTENFCYHMLAVINLRDTAYPESKQGGRSPANQGHELIEICVRHWEAKTRQLPLSNQLNAISDEVSGWTRLDDARGAMLASAADIFRKGAGGDDRLRDELRPYSANRDRLSVAMNSGSLGVYLKKLDDDDELISFSEDRCMQFILHLCLADRNALALTTCGMVLHKWPVREWPDTLKALQNERIPPVLSCFSYFKVEKLPRQTPQLTPEELNQVEVGSGPAYDYLKLDLAIIESSQMNSTFCHLERMALHRSTYPGPAPGTGGKPSLFRDQLQFFDELTTAKAVGNRTKLFLQDVGSLDKSHTSDVFLRRVHAFYCHYIELESWPGSIDFDLEPGSELSKTFHAAALEALCLCFSLGESWIVDAVQRHSYLENLTIPQGSPSRLFERDGGPPDGDDWAKDKDRLSAARRLFVFLTYIMLNSFPFDRGAGSLLFWRPLSFRTHDKSQALTFGPVFDDVVLAVPQVLARADFKDLSRVYWLQKRDEANEFHLLGTSKAIGCADLTILSKSGSVIEGAVVYGPQKGTWWSALAAMHKSDILGDGYIPLYKDCLRLTKQCSTTETVNY